MAVTYRSKSAVVNTSGTSPTPTEPAGAASGDYILAVFAVTGTSGDPALPAGWTALYSLTTVGSVFEFIVGGIVRGGSAPSYAFVHVGSVYRELHVLCFQGSASITLDSQSSSGANGSATNHNPDPGSTTAVASTSLSVAFGINWGGSAVAWVAGVGYTIRSDNTAGNDCVISDKSLSASGAENPAAYTGVVAAGSQGYWDGATITLTDAGAGGSSIVAIADRQYRQRRA